jgi:hypothetical protein
MIRTEPIEVPPAVFEWPLCGATKRYDALVPPLVCNQPHGHLGPHGVSLAGLPPYVAWGRE